MKRYLPYLLVGAFIAAAFMFGRSSSAAATPSALPDGGSTGTFVPQTGNASDPYGFGYGGSSQGTSDIVSTLREPPSTPPPSGQPVAGSKTIADARPGGFHFIIK